MITRNCDYCQGPYEADPKYLKRGQGLFCSRSCSSRRERKKKEPNTVCAYCEMPLYRKKSTLERTTRSFCSKEHQNLAALAESECDYTTGPSPKNGIQRLSGSRKCPQPGCETRTMGQYGCLQHSPSIRIAGLIDLWLSGDVSATWSGPNREVKVFVKRYLLETRGDSCEQCGFSKKSPEGNSVIQMDHIDGNYQNNLIDNLQLLCPNCHAMTPTYGSRNNQGRAYRRKNYMN